jgi:hypothetical protein
MLEKLESVAWERFDAPDEYVPAAVPRALRALAAAASMAEADRAYHGVLFAIGNDHAGTLWPAAVGAVPFAVEIALVGSSSARWGALQVLIDLLAFEPAPGYDTIVDEHGVSSDLREALKARISGAIDSLKLAASTAGATEEIRNATGELISNLD